MNKDNTEQTANPRSKKAVVLGILLLAFQIGILFAYGFAGQFQFMSTSNISIINQPLWLSLYFYLTLFVVGMGLMLSFYGKGTALGLGTAIFALALNILLGPLLQKFWFNIFISNFYELTLSTSSSNFLVTYYLGDKVNISAVMLSNSATMTVSYLIAALGFIGRAGLFQIFTSLLVFNVMWPISFFVNLKIYLNDISSKLAFDDFGLTYVYTFAAIFGIIYSVMLNKKENTVENSHVSKSSIILAIFGATLVFCTQPTIGFNYQRQVASNRVNVGFLNIYYSSIASIIVCTIFSALIGKGRFKIEQIIVSVLSGPAISAQIAGTQGNIAAFLTIGAFGGLLTAIWIQVIHPKLNKNSIQDSMGLIGGVLIPSFFGGVVVAPVLFRIYNDNGSKKLTGIFNDQQLIRHNYYYYFITVGTAMVGGIIAGLLACCAKSNQNQNTHYKIFSPDFGLCNNPSDEPYIDDGKKRNDQKQQSADNLKKN